MVDETESGGTCKVQSTPPVAPAKTSDERRESKAHEEQEREIILVLPSDNLVTGQVGDIRDADLASRFNDHPANMSPPEALVS